MGKIYLPKPVKLIVSIFGAEEYLINYYKEILIKEFGPVDLESNIQPFNFTDYYATEFGKNLIQKLYSFETLIPAERLPEIKKRTNDLESRFGSSSNRKINLDPGYISLDKFILASTKNGPSRIYLNSGIYAEITLRYINQSFIPGEYTYPNYKTEEYINFLNKVREKYKLQLRKYSDKLNQKNKKDKADLTFWKP